MNKKDNTDLIDNAAILPKDPRVLLLIAKHADHSILLLESVGGAHVATTLKKLFEKGDLVKEHAQLDPVGSDVYLIPPLTDQIFNFSLSHLLGVLDLTAEIKSEIDELDHEEITVQFIVNY